MLFQTTAAHEELRAKIRSFAEEEIKPLAFMMDQNNEFPEEAVKKLGKLGWMGIPSVVLSKPDKKYTDIRRRNTRNS